MTKFARQRRDAWSVGTELTTLSPQQPATELSLSVSISLCTPVPYFCQDQPQLNASAVHWMPLCTCASGRTWKVVDSFKTRSTTGTMDSRHCAPSIHTLSGTSAAMRSKAGIFSIFLKNCSLQLLCSAHCLTALLS